MPADPLPGVIPSPNIWRFPAVYETENRGVDPDGLIEATIQRLHHLAGATVLDLGCGTGYHLPWFARHAHAVIGVEPHEPLLRLARQRLQAEPDPVRERVRLHRGTAQQVPLADASVDVVHARWSYFFGPGCEPGLAELARVVRPGGTAFVIDNDATRSTFGRWFSAGLPSYDAAAVETFWAEQGFTREPLDVRWSMSSRADLEAVVRIEFAPALARRLLAGHPGTEVDYAVNLWWRRYWGPENSSASALCDADAGEHTVVMTTASPDPTPTRLPLRHRNPPINPSQRPSPASVVSLVVIGIGYLISLVAPSLLVSPSAPSAPMSRVLAAFGFTLLGVVVSVVAGFLAFRRTRNWAWLIITGVPAVSLVAGGAILAATKVIT